MTSHRSRSKGHLRLVKPAEPGLSDKLQRVAQDPEFLNRYPRLAPLLGDLGPVLEEILEELHQHQFNAKAFERQALKRLFDVLLLEKSGLLRRVVRKEPFKRPLQGKPFFDRAFMGTCREGVWFARCVLVGKTWTWNKRTQAWDEAPFSQDHILTKSEAFEVIDRLPLKAEPPKSALDCIIGGNDPFK